jgi:hypothetical protein
MMFDNVTSQVNLLTCRLVGKLMLRFFLKSGFLVEGHFQLFAKLIGELNSLIITINVLKY